MTAIPRQSFHTSRPTRERVAQARLPGIIVAYMVIFLLPIELSFYAGPLFMTPIRIFLLVTALPLLVLLFRHENLMAIDGLLAAYVLWVVLAYMVKRGGGGIEAAGQSFLEITVPYLVARLFLKSPQQIARFLKIMCIIIAILGLLAIPEAVLQVRFLHEIPKMLTGITYEMQADIRQGLLRAASTFENPILFGLYCAMFLSLIWYSTFGIGTRLALVVGIIMATMTSLSSAPILLLLLQILLIMVERASRRIRLRTPLIAASVLAAVVFIEAFSNRGVARLIAAKLTLNPHTGYYRLLQWEFSIDDVRANPMFGINLENWTRPHWMTDSIDNHWLFLAMNSGVPAVTIIFITMALLAYRLYRRRQTIHDPMLKSLMLGWIIGISALFLGAWTVTLFGKMQPTLFFLVGLGAALLQMKDSTVFQEATAPNPVDRAKQHRYSRFAPTPCPRIAAQLQGEMATSEHRYSFNRS